MEDFDTGILINKDDIKLHRKYFSELCKLLGINVIYKAPRNKTYDLHGELDSKYYDSIVTGCIFEEHPNQWTMKKFGWTSELQESTSIINVPYDLPHLQAGALFIIPSGIDGAEGRVFKVLRLSNIMVYPASIACEIGPVFKDDDDITTSTDFTKTDFNLLNDGSVKQ